MIHTASNLSLRMSTLRVNIEFMVFINVQGCAQDDRSGGYLPAKVVQNCSKCSISGLNYSVKPA